MIEANNCNRDVGVLGIDMSDGVNPCHDCGGYPIVVYARPLVKGVRHKRAYYHCQCGECVTDWAEGDTVKDAISNAREAWKRKDFIVCKKFGKS